MKRRVTKTDIAEVLNLRSHLAGSREACNVLTAKVAALELELGKARSDVAALQSATSLLSSQRTQLINMCDRLIGGAP